MLKKVFILLLMLVCILTASCSQDPAEEIETVSGTEAVVSAAGSEPEPVSGVLLGFIFFALIAGLAVAGFFLLKYIKPGKKAPFPVDPQTGRPDLSAFRMPVNKRDDD